MNITKKIKYLFLSLRPAQWIKNLFIFLPLIFGGRLFDFSIALKTTVSFFIFSIAASTVYLINDIIDLKNDKLHPVKRLRPLASGKITVFQAKFTATVIGSISIAFSFVVSPYFGLIIIVYLLFNIFYTKFLKNAVIVDVLCIGFFFLLRIVAGSIAAEVKLSHWIIFCTALLALFLGFNKRRYELKLLKKRAHYHRSVLARYNLYFIDQMISVTTTSIAIVYILYTVDANTVKNFGTDHLIYSIPFVYYGIFRYLYLVHKRGKGGDPTHILLSDTKLQLNLLLWIIVCVAVIYFKI